MLLRQKVIPAFWIVRSIVIVNFTIFATFLIRLIRNISVALRKRKKDFAQCLSSNMTGN